MGGGCFWCIEAFFQRLKGVEQVVSGYSGGHQDNPTYEQVCSGATGHAEVVQVAFNPEQISFRELLRVFWSVHDPTTLNRQGADVGSQYRSVIFYQDEEQRLTSMDYKRELNDRRIFPNPVVTEITPFTRFFAAERCHQDYYINNSGQSYCRLVIAPKLEQFNALFAWQLKP